MDGSVMQKGSNLEAGRAPALAGIHHVGLTVADVEASEAWYARVLGLRRVFVEPHHGSDGAGYAVVLGIDDSLGFNIGLDHHAASRGEAFDAARTGLDHLCLHVGTRGDLEAWAAHLDREGVGHDGIIQVQDSVAVLNFRDPDGIALELIAFA